MKIYLIRHTSVDVPPGTCYGQADVPLKDTFEEEAQRVKKKLNNITFDAVYSSPLSRCVRLANYCNLGDIQLFDRLKELNFGDWEMQDWSQIEATAWHANWINTPTLNGESFEEMYNRVASFLDQLKETEYKSVAIFAHGGVIACARVYFGQVKMDKAFDKKTEYGEVVKFEL